MRAGYVLGQRRDAPVDAVAYLTDLEQFPRDEVNQPAWLKAKLVEARAARDP
ncbi:hypothetical protein [Pseudoclavibacter sp. AY1F1]|uniref:hypothetical protein n=1 Tax=Pseudoclavibacter sp. AY1F1 TaxID=2080583 RepID=UPI0015E42133|nr:hypothetical protein [Pseudoclavibacter sp. AY1F1]